MNSIGKIQASLASATQETTLALANANFDFSLIKFEAPAEYKELGLALAEKKRSEAEAGSAHVTARRLGSLFHTMLPETPNLIRAYGTRASEIAKSPAVNPRGTEEYGPIRDYVGVDGTSIWAAATSGSAAIAAHLLACLIACCWRADEATAIWLEIVSERKRRLEEKTSSADYFDLTEAISSKLTLEKDQLANWDASARAWLAAADDAPVIRSRQKSVRGLLNHLNASVNSRQDLYTSVTEAWKLSLETLENVITGTSYSIQDGAVVVALVAWHLYPDLIILGPQIQDIKQNDVLIESGGVVTIGLATPIAVEDTSRGSGVHWSLSLGHLRYYGTTRTTSRSLASTPSGNSRFTFTEFVLIFLGAMIGLWSENETVSLESALSFIELAVTKFEETITASYEASIAQGMLKGSWIRILKDAIGLCNDRLPAKREEIRKLVHLGLRRPGFATIMHTRFDPTVTPRYRLFGLDTLMFVEALHETADQDMFLEKSIQQFMAKRPHAPAPAGPVKNHFLLLVGERGAEWVELLFYSKITPPDLERSKTGYDKIKEIRSDGGPGLTLIGWFSRVSGVECRQSDLAKWQIVNHNQFDGRLEDHFTSTSLHLRFTGYTREIDFGAHNKISNGSFVEAVVSAYDSGDWLGDVNILRALSSSWLKFVVPLNGCTGDAVGKAPERELVTVENWEELLSPHPSLPGVIKCYGNWQARLTAVSICVQRGYHTFLFDNHGCWRCAFEQLDFLTQQWTPQDLETPSDSEKTSTGPESDTDDDIDDAGLDREHAANKADDGGNHAGPISPSTERHMPLSNDDKSCHDDDESSSSSDDEEPCGPVRPFPPPPPGIRKVHTIFIL
ncbi:Uu.00g109630.m01.CDS01 [Anthostomella pinea]|uniref:Uu.00g109630.m01.CDS01 n=1 Tax=Anthostomella pinea TaxID=933095 RepID=A0AAI8YG37_9PEZI|nr:Uu.00g109630.m01.CDS01 [Anthostomella pinea]